MRNADSPEEAVAWLEARFEQEWAAFQALPSPAVGVPSWLRSWFGALPPGAPFPVPAEEVVAGFESPASPG